MPNYLRLVEPGGTYFFTVVTYHRRPIFNSQDARKILGEVFRAAICKYPFKMDAICLLPDHIHCIWTLPDTDSNYSLRWSFIKSNFSRRFKEMDPNIANLSNSRQSRRERGIWQRRYWEHLIRDDVDLAKHMDYIHYNPIKHDLVEKVEDWEWSSYHKYLQDERYPLGENRSLKEININGSDEWG